MDRALLMGGVLLCSLIIGVFENSIPSILILIPAFGIGWGLVALMLD